MSYEYITGKTGVRVRWSCDVDGCTEQADVTGSRVEPVMYLKPPDWSGVLVTSVTDGDRSYIQCPTHTLHMQRMYREDTDLFKNRSAVGG